MNLALFKSTHPPGSRMMPSTNLVLRLAAVMAISLAPLVTSSADGTQTCLHPSRNLSSSLGKSLPGNVIKRNQTTKLKSCWCQCFCLEDDSCNSVTVTPLGGGEILCQFSDVSETGSLQDKLKTNTFFRKRTPADETKTEGTTTVSATAATAAATASATTQQTDTSDNEQGPLLLTGRNIDQRMVPVNGEGILLRRYTYNSSDECATKCNKRINDGCISFNFHENMTVCELLKKPWYESSEDLKMLMSPGWSHFQQEYSEDKKDPCSPTPCSSDSVCIRYSQLVTDHFDSSLKLYACTKNTGLKQRFDSGFTDCYFNILYGIDYKINQISDYAEKEASLQDHFDQCIDHDCMGFVCQHGTTEKITCWMKNGTYKPEGIHEQNPTLNTWIARCENRTEIR